MISRNDITMGIMMLNIAILVGAAWMMFFPFQLTETLNEPFPVSPSVVAKGDTITVEVEFIKYNNYSVEINKNIICDDGNLVTLAPITSFAPVGHHNIFIEVQIPEKSSIGNCHLEFTNTYHLNPLRDETVIRESQSFTIIE